MSTSDRLLLFLHVGFAIFTLGPLTAATMSAPRYIRNQNVTVLKYLHRTTQIYGLASLGIFLFGLFLAKGQFAKVWLSASMTLFIVALVLLFLVIRDQGKAIKLLEIAAAEAVPAPTPAAPADEEAVAGKKDEKTERASPPRADVAQVERGRIAAMSGVIALIWLVILFLMVYYG